MIDNFPLQFAFICIFNAYPYCYLGCVYGCMIENMYGMLTREERYGNKNAQVK